MKYHNITKDDMLNGDGLRVVLWVAGCEHKCKGCHNPITWNRESGADFTNEVKKELFSELKKEHIAGLTLSGGDPLATFNRAEITDLVKEIKEKYPDKTIWIYTGYSYEEIKDLPIIEYIDVLCDGKFILEKKDTSIPWVGSSNQRVIRLK